MGQDIMIEEAYPEAAEVLRAAGWAPHDLWGVYTRGTLVMGFQPDRSGFHVKNWGMDVHGPDTPDDPVEAAQWLVARFGEAHQDAAHETDSMALPQSNAADAALSREIRDLGTDDSQETDGEIVPEGTDEFGVTAPTDAAEGLVHETDSEIGEAQQFADDVGEVLGSVCDQGSAANGADSAISDDHPADDALGGSEAGIFEPASRFLADASGPDLDDTTDAAFDEIAVEGADLLELPPPEPEDFAPDEIVPDKVAEAVAIFGDDLPMARLLLIGAVTRHAAGLKAILQDGWTVSEFAALQNQIMRISEGLAPDDEHARARFAALSEASRAMSTIDAHAEVQVAFLENASRDEIAAYKPEEGWP